MKREEAIKDLDIIRFNPHWDENYAEFYRTSNEYGLSKPRINRDCIYEVIGNKFDNPELLEE